jgi:hypothetical protein
MLPRAFIEYVMVHELVHLIDPHHLMRFGIGWSRLGLMGAITSGGSLRMERVMTFRNCAEVGGMQH